MSEKGAYAEYGFMLSISNWSCELYDGPPHGGETNTASAYISDRLTQGNYFMDLLKDITRDKLYFIQYAIDLRIMLCTRNLDWINVNSNDFVEIFSKLNRIATHLNTSAQYDRADTPQKASTIVLPEHLLAMNLAKCRAMPSGVTLYHASSSIQTPSSYLENSRYR